MQYQMPPELTKEERAMLNELPPLPQPLLETNGDVFGHENEQGYTSAQMRSYALEAVRAERERCATVAEKSQAGDGRAEARNVTARRIAAAIRSGKP